jgi:hypothetical protein
MARFKNIKKQYWTYGELLSAVNNMGRNSYALSALDYEFPEMATKNAAGEMVIDCGEEMLTAFDLVLNLQARHLERFINGYLSSKGHELEDFWQEHYDEFHRLLTGIITGFYQGRGMWVAID